MLLNKAKFWQRNGAERNFAEILKAGISQEIVEADGVFVVRFEAAQQLEPAGLLLSRGGPVKDGD
ncbi:hypothetical protein NKZ03_26985 [Sinorhizobium meliloti]|uniref:hypothetical protein n=1 Tax=Rhizobium meliloti TaxID=382 RepID=UPI001F38E8D0|nr:hypothetical protein [Sinorhizobium meliloti]